MVYEGSGYYHLTKVCNIGSTKSIEPAGPLEITLGRGETFQNANKAVGGFYYEIQVETLVKRVQNYSGSTELTLMVDVITINQHL